MKIKDEILKILMNCQIEDTMVFLPKETLDRKTYMAVNDVLTSLGGKWDRKTKSHVFPENPTDVFEECLTEGEYSSTKEQNKIYQFFKTPQKIVEKMIEHLDLKNEHDVLEPSAGDGAIAEFIPDKNKLVCIELNPERAKILKDKGFNVIEQDFLQHDKLYDRIIMNPPFTKLQDVKHVFHAFSLLKEGGKLVSIVSESPFFRSGDLCEKFRELIDMQGKSFVLDEGSFKESGTMVRTRIVVLEK